MKLRRVFSYFVLCLSLTISISTRVEAATYTIHFTDAGPRPTELDVKIGDVINWDQSFAWMQTVILTDANGQRITILDHECIDDVIASYTVMMAGNYQYEDKVDIGSGETRTYLANFYCLDYPGSTSYRIALGNAGPIPASLEVHPGDTLNFRTAGAEDFFDMQVDFLSIPGKCIGIGDQMGKCADTGFSFIVIDQGTYTYDEYYYYGQKHFPGSFTVLASSGLSVADEHLRTGLSLTLDQNPTTGSGMIRLVSERPLDLRLGLFDMLGRLVHDYDMIELGSSDYTLPLSATDLPNGEYYLRAISGGAAMATTKVMIMH